MKKFEEPIMEINLFDEENILTASSTGADLGVEDGSGKGDFVWGEQVTVNMLDN